MLFKIRLSIEASEIDLKLVLSILFDCPIKALLPFFLTSEIIF